jgi:hypothetical protein
MPSAVEIRAFGRRLKSWAYSPEGDDLLQAHSVTSGADSWVAGGCVPLAVALHEVLPSSRFYAVWSVGGLERRWSAQTFPVQAQHVGVMLNGLFVDGLGARLPRSAIRWWAVELVDPVLAPIDEDGVRGIIREVPDGDVNDLVITLMPIIESLL